MGVRSREDLAAAKSKWAYRTVGLILAGAAIGILGNTLLRPLITAAAVADVVIFLAAFVCLVMLIVRTVESWFRPQGVDIVAGPAWWQRLSRAAKAAYLTIAAVGATAAAIVKPLPGDSGYALRWGAVGAIILLLLMVTALFRRR